MIKKEREQPNQKTNPPMTTSVENYTKKTKQNKAKQNGQIEP